MGRGRIKYGRLALLLLFLRMPVNAQSVVDTIIIDGVPALDNARVPCSTVISAETDTISFTDSYLKGTANFSCPDSSQTIILLYGTKPMNMLTGYSFLNFSMDTPDSVSGCTTRKIQFRVDSSRTDSFNLYLTAFKALSYTISYPQADCNSTQELLYPQSDLGLANVKFSGDVGLVLQDSGVVNLAKSSPGTHYVTADSKYCLTQKQIPVGIAKSYSLLDTFDVCNGVLMNSPDSGDFTISKPGASPIADITDIQNSGEYTITNNSPGCSSVDTVYISVSKTSVTIDTEETCNSVKLTAAASSSLASYSLEWSDSSKGSSLEAFSDGPVSVKITDAMGCSSSATFDVKIHRLKFESALVQTTPANCWDEGKVKLTSSSVAGYVGRLQYLLHNTLNDQYVTNLDNVPEGVYTLRVVDGRNCKSDYGEKFTVLLDCMDKYPVFTPNGDGKDDEYFISYQGKIKIFDRYGKLLIELEAPAYWDGKDSRGVPLPMGNYLMVNEQGKVLNISIIK